MTISRTASRTSALAATALVIACTGALLGPAAAHGESPDVPPAPAVATDTLAVTHAQNPRVPHGASWTQHYFPSADGSGTELHADVLLPQGLAPGEQVPVVLSVGPYFGHSGQLVAEGYPHVGPTIRHDELLTEGRLLERGYALVRVDLRGFGGSSGCHDLFGPGEQADVAAAIEWSSRQPWSTGAVGMYGQSYDGVTPLIGDGLDPDVPGRGALRAVVTQEPIWDPYTNFRSGDVPRATIESISKLYLDSTTRAQMPDDDPRYRANAAWELSDPTCLTDMLNQYKTPRRESEFWQARDLPAMAQGSDTPLLFTQGFLEWNTEAQSMQTYLDHHEGVERGWIGPWDHVRADERGPDGTPLMGREGWFEEVFAFYDEHLKGIAPAVRTPAFAVQDSTGAWRSQDVWPAVDREVSLELGGGTYTDDGASSSFVTRSEPVTVPTRLTGTPRVDLQARGGGNVQVRLHDVRPDGSAIVVDQQVADLQEGTTELELRSTDWSLPVGHSLAVEIGTIEPAVDFRAEDWLPTSSGAEVTVTAATLHLALDDPSDDVATAGVPAAWLPWYVLTYGATFPAGPGSFTLPNPR